MQPQQQQQQQPSIARDGSSFVGGGFGGGGGSPMDTTATGSNSNLNCFVGCGGFGFGNGGGRGGGRKQQQQQQQQHGRSTSKSRSAFMEGWTAPFKRRRYKSPSRTATTTATTTDGSDGTTTTTTTTTSPLQTWVKDASIEDQTDAITQALNTLSVEELESAYHDIHGVAERTVEDYNFIQHILQQMEYELQQQLIKLSSSSSSSSSKGEGGGEGTGYQLATTIEEYNDDDESPNNNNFKLHFLRAEEYQPKLAAKRMIQYYDEKLELFGRNKLTSKITLNDLSQEDIECLSSGCVQRISQTDRSNRPIIMILPTLVKFHNPSNLVRSMYYVFMSVVVQDNNDDDDDEHYTTTNHNHIKEEEGTNISNTNNINSTTTTTTTTTGGLVQVAHFLPGDDHRAFVDRMVMFQTHKLRSVLPIRYASVHLYSNDPKLPLLLNLFRTFITTKTLSRIRMHYGTEMEIQYKLLSYGIPVAALPLSVDGDPNTEYHLKWLEERRQMEMKMEMKTTINNNANRRRNTTPPISSSMTTALTSSPYIKSITESKMIAKHDTNHNNDDEGGGDQGAMGKSTEKKDATSHGGSGGGESSKGNIIYEPSPSDVLLGRGRTIDNREGNVKFRNLLAEHLERYDRALKFQKTEIAQCLLEHLKETEKVRFLKQVPNNNINGMGNNNNTTDEDGEGCCWEEADDKTVREKISRTFRRIRETHRGSKLRGVGGL